MFYYVLIFSACFMLMFTFVYILEMLCLYSIVAVG